MDSERKGCLTSERAKIAASAAISCRCVKKDFNYTITLEYYYLLFLVSYSDNRQINTKKNIS